MTPLGMGAVGVGVLGAAGIGLIVFEKWQESKVNPNLSGLTVLVNAADVTALANDGSPISVPVSLEAGAVAHILVNEDRGNQLFGSVTGVTVGLVGLAGSPNIRCTFSRNAIIPQK